MKTAALLIAAYALGFATPMLIRVIHGYIAGAIWQWRELQRERICAARVQDAKDRGLLQPDDGEQP
jgi:hypothetical protein